jgi:hypothetical protein
MDLPERDTHSFIIKIWIEEINDGTGNASWRGHITHVPGGERRYLRNLDEIVVFIEPFLARMGVKLRRWERLLGALLRLVRWIGFRMW